MFKYLAFLLVVIPRVHAQTPFNEGANDAPAQFYHPDVPFAGSLPITGSLIRVNGVGDADVYAVCNPWTTVTIDRWFTETSRASEGTPRAAETFVSYENTLDSDLHGDLRLRRSS